jgi:hypothetical protein
MRELREMIMAGPLAELFFAQPNGKKTVVPAKVTETKTKARRGPIKPAPEETRCEALVYSVEMNADGEWVPARCKRSMVKDCKFCKQHGAVDGKKNEGDSAFYGKDIIHEFKWQHLGTVHQPSYIFTKFHDDLVKVQLTKEKSSQESIEVGEKPSKTKKVAKADKPKRIVANGYIFYKSSVYEEVKQSIQAQNPEMKGKKLMTTITKIASEQWNELSAEERAAYTEKAKAAKGIASANNTSDTEVEQDTASVSNDSDNVDDDSASLVYNEKYQVWVDTSNNLCYSQNDNTSEPSGQLQRGNYIKFPGK